MKSSFFPSEMKPGSFLFEIRQSSDPLMRKKGTSLLEIIIVTAIVSVLGLLLAVILVNTNSIFHTESAKVSQGLGLNDALLNVRQNIKLSDSIAAGYPINTPTYSSSSTQLVLKIPAIDSSKNIITNTYDYIIYLVESGKFKEKVFPDSLSHRNTMDQILVSNVSSLDFQYFDDADQIAMPVNGKKVKVTIQVRQKAGANFQSQIATSEAYLKND